MKRENFIFFKRTHARTHRMVAEAAKPKKKQGPPSAMMLAAQNRAHEARNAANGHPTTPTPGRTTPPHPPPHPAPAPAAANAGAAAAPVSASAASISSK
jgi:hypothetical protein